MAKKELINQFKDSIIELCDSVVCSLTPNIIVKGCINGVRSVLSDRVEHYTTLELCDKFNVSTEQIRRMGNSGYFIKVARNKWDRQSVDEYYVKYYKR